MQGEKTMYDVIALGELLIDFAPQSKNEMGYPVLAASLSTRKHGGITSVPDCAEVESFLE